MSNAILGEIPHIDRLERLSPVCTYSLRSNACVLRTGGVRGGPPSPTAPPPPPRPPQVALAG